MSLRVINNPNLIRSCRAKSRHVVRGVSTTLDTNGGWVL
jgi:hypothetical protein